MKKMKTLRKVLAYITRGEEPDWEILVFQQKDNPDSGIQVPGGTIESDEFIIDALYREIEEETGITRENLELKGKDEGMTFCHRFVPVDQIPVLSGNQDEAINF